MRKSLILSIAVFVVSPPAFSQNIDCEKDSGSYVTQYCSSLEFEAADKKLNLSYKRLIELLTPEHKIAIREIQRTWVKQRNAFCDLETSPTAGSTGYATFHNECLIRLTNARTKDFEKAIEFWSS